jgi:predicted O-methyltransferase YrrM
MKKYSEYRSFLTAHGLDKVLYRSMNAYACQKILAVVEEIQPQTILEIGRAKGHTMGLFAWACDADIVSIDIVRYPEAEEIAELFPNRIEMLDGTSELCQTGDLQMFDLILVDGDHTYQGCRSDWNNIQDSMTDNCVVLFDDLDHPAGCGKVFEELAEWKELVTADNVPLLGIVRKGVKSLLPPQYSSDWGK